MSRLPLLTRDDAPATSRPVLDHIQRAFGTVPNMFRAVAHSPAALQSMWGAFGALGSAGVGAALGERIAIAVAERNRCGYCLAAHTVLGAAAGVSTAELSAARDGASADPRAAAALRFAMQLVEGRGHVTAVQVQAAQEAGLSSADVVDVIAHVALNLFTNMVNVALDVPIDFPEVALKG